MAGRPTLELGTQETGTIAALAGELAGIDGNLTRTRLLRCAATLTAGCRAGSATSSADSRQVVAD